MLSTPFLFVDMQAQLPGLCYSSFAHLDQGAEGTCIYMNTAAYHFQVGKAESRRLKAYQGSCLRQSPQQCRRRSAALPVRAPAPPPAHDPLSPSPQLYTSPLQRQAKVLATEQEDNLWPNVLLGLRYDMSLHTIWMHPFKSGSLQMEGLPQLLAFLPPTPLILNEEEPSHIICLMPSFPGACHH